MDSLDNLARAVTDVQKEKVVEQLAEYLIQNDKLNKMNFLMFDGEDGDCLSKKDMMKVFEGKEPSVVRKGRENYLGNHHFHTKPVLLMST